MSSLQVRGLNQHYGESHTLWDVELDVPEGKCTCVMGRNGMGKTTLLKAIMGLVPSSSGSIQFRGTELTQKAAPDRARLGVGYVPQGREIFPQLSIEENLRVGLGARRDNVREVPRRIYELFPVLEEMLGRRGGDLSGGQQQQLAIGRALAIDPTILLLDEPGEGIQPNIVTEIAELIKRLTTEFGITVLLVEQKLPFVHKVADRFTILDNGRSVAAGELAELSDELIERHLTV